MTPRLEVNCAFNVPPHGFFSPLHPEVIGSFSVRFEENIRQVTAIRLGLKGVVEARYREVRAEWDSEEDDYELVRHVLHESHTLFDKHEKLVAEIPDEFLQGDELEKLVRFTFPVNKRYLPSSCVRLGSLEDDCGDIRVTYELYVEVEYTSKITEKSKTKTYTEIVPYQAQNQLYDVELHPAPFIMDYPVHKVFTSKIKPLYYNRQVRALIPGDLISGHPHTRSVRSFFNDKYKAAQQEQMQRDVGLTTTFRVQNLLDLLSPLQKLVGLKFQAKLKSLQPDFSCCGESTGLGSFDIVRLVLYCQYKVGLRVGEHKSTHTGELPLLKVNFNPGTARIDIKDFWYDRESQRYSILPGPNFYSSICEGSLIDILQYPCLMNGEAENFRCRSWLKVELVLASSNRKENLERTYEAVTDGEFYVGEIG